MNYYFVESFCFVVEILYSLESVNHYYFGADSLIMECYRGQ